MDLESAKAARPLVERIVARNDKIANISNAAAHGWRINTIRAFGPDGNEMNVIIDSLDGETSAKVLSFVLQIYQTELDGLNQELAAL